jgi:hypothetical protein
MGVDVATFPLPDRKGDDIRRMIPLEILPVDLTDLFIIDKKQADFLI